MKKLNESFWDSKYKEQKTGWDIGSISKPIKKYIDQLKNKNLKILIPGAGNGHEVEYLFNLGFKNVFVLDISKYPLENLKYRIPNFPDSHLINNDFFKHNGRYDLIIEQTFFCALNPKLRNKYVKKMNNLLNENGKIVGLFFNSEFTEEGPPFGGNNDEYLKLFNPLFNIRILENCYNSIKPRKNNELFFIFEKNIMNMKSSEILNNEQIINKTRRIAYQIYESNYDENEIIIAGINGNGYIFAKKIAEVLKEISDLEIKLCKIVLDKKNPLNNITTDLPPEHYKNKSLVLIDDVLNSGSTLIYGIKHFLEVPLKQFKTAVLINRNHKKYPVKADFKGISLSTSLQEHISVSFSEDKSYAILD